MSQKLSSAAVVIEALRAKFSEILNTLLFLIKENQGSKFFPYSRGARDSKIGKKWPESSRILDYILSYYGVSEV